MTATIHDRHNDMYDGPTVELFETVKTTTRLMDEARVKQAEAVAALISAHVTPLDDFTHGLHAVFTSNPGAGPLVTNGKAGQSSGVQASVGVDDVVACVALPSGEVCTVASVERVPDELPTPTEGVLAKVLDCTRAQVVTLVRKIMTAVVLMPKLWSLVKQGVIGFDRVLYTVGRVGRAGVCIPVFDYMLTSKRVDVPWKTFKRHVNEVLAMLTTPESRSETARRHRSVSYWVNDDGTATLSLTGPVLEMEAFYQRVRGTARAIMANHIEPFTATLTDEQQALFITDNNGETAEVRVGDLGRVEVDDDRLMDQLTLDLITGAKPSTTLRVRVTPTGKQAPIRVTYTKDAFTTGTPDGPGAESDGEFEAGTPGMENARGDGGGPGSGESGSVWADRREARQAEDVYELELCVSMPEKEEWLKSQASINLTVPVLHFLMDTPPNQEQNPERNRNEQHRPGAGQEFHRHRVDERRPEGQIPARKRSRRDINGEQAFTYQGSSAPSGVGPGQGEQLFNDQGTGVPSGADVPPGREEALNSEEFLNADEPLIADEPVGVSSELDFGLPVKVDPDVRVPVMMNGRVPLDAKTADEVIARAKWVYRMFTDPQTGVVLESAPTKYYIPAALKRMVEARYPFCGVPWCAVPARVCEKDHIEPFNHKDPESGGLTVMENLHPLCKRHHQEKTQKRLRVDKMDDGSLAWVLPRIGAMLVYPPESRINQLQYERLLEYFDTGDQDISHTINNYLATEQASTHSQAPNPETPAQTDKGTGGQTAGSGDGRTVGQIDGRTDGAVSGYDRAVADEYALAGEVFNGDTRPWEPSNEPPPF